MKAKAVYLSLAVFAFISVISRLVLNLWYIDSRGFYQGGTAWVAVQWIAIILTVSISTLLLPRLNKPCPEEASFPCHFSGIVLVLAGLCGLIPNFLLIANEIKFLVSGYSLSWDSLAPALLLAVTCLVFLYIGFYFAIAKKQRQISPLLTLIPVLWQFTLLFHVFSVSHAIAGISEQKFQLLAAASGVIFWFAHSRVNSNVDAPKGRQLVLASGGCYLVFQACTLIPTLLGIRRYLDASRLMYLMDELLFLLLLWVYSLLFFLSILKSSLQWNTQHPE